MKQDQAIVDLPALPAREIAELLREAAHTMEVAIRFAQCGMGPTVEELTEWRAVMYRLKAADRAEPNTSGNLSVGGAGMVQAQGDEE